jgi:hypothetical protein
MPTFKMSDLENLKRVGANPQEIHYNLSNAILNSDTIAANVRTLDQVSGHFEIVLTGTIGRKLLEQEVKPTR